MNSAIENQLLGYPDQFGQPHYGLYHTLFGCFMLTVCDINHANEIKMLASSRYNMYVINLNTACNYTTNLIDNTCCENWTFSNTSDIDQRHAFLSKVLCATQLVPSTGNDPEVFQEKQYLQLVYESVLYCNMVIEVSQKHMDDWINDMFDIDMADERQEKTKNLLRKLKQIVYLGTDVSDMKQQISLIKKQIGRDW